jgi:hypothetical protein
MTGAKNTFMWAVFSSKGQGSHFWLLLRPLSCPLQNVLLDWLMQKKADTFLVLNEDS